MTARRRTPKRYRRRIPDEQKLELARQDLDRAMTAVFRAAAILARSRDLVRYYEGKLGLEPKAQVVASRALAGAVEEVKKESRTWLARFGFDVPEQGRMPEART